MSVYVRNVLDLVEVCPEVAVRVWEVVIDRMIRIDVSSYAASRGFADHYIGRDTN